MKNLALLLVVAVGLIATVPEETHAQTRTAVINSSGDGLGNRLNVPCGVAVGPAADVYVCGLISEPLAKLLSQPSLGN